MKNLFRTSLRSACVNSVCPPKLIGLCLRTIQGLTDASVEFGLIPNDHWYQPDWIDEDKASAAREEMVKNNVIYGCTLTFLCPLKHFLMQY